MPLPQQQGMDGYDVIDARWTVAVAFHSTVQRGVLHGKRRRGHLGWSFWHCPCAARVITAGT